MSYKITQHVFGTENSGGPIVALERLTKLNLDNEFSFHRLTQPYPAGGINFKLLNYFVKELKLTNPDLIHVRGLGNEGFHGVFAARIARVPKILVSVHGTVRDLKFSKSKIRNSIVRDLLEPATLRMATHIMTVCDYAAKRDLLIPYSNKFAGVVHNGVDSPLLDIETRKKIRLEHGVKNGDIVSVCVSRITREKGYFLLADALSKLPKLNKTLHVWVVGDGPDRVEIEALMPRRADIVIRFLGHRNDVHRFLQGADIFIFPSLHENLSNALLEGMSFGLPPIAFAVGGNNEVIKNGSIGLIPPYDVNSFTRAISIYIEYDTIRQNDGILAKAHVKQNFSINTMANNMFDIYRRILK